MIAFSIVALVLFMPLVAAIALIATVNSFGEPG
ncbi:lipopolysaccharide/colanic/teichoic acid biosynthesis glycosyltransferase [Bradyrhizobium elkanii]|nr:lipopolysaccharide/colanic/teichoic acid biosynthesis glycosyltransferase [Bradyrhizobium elkanii]MCW2167877.1 lipopolysaccharide/colanic/teichoic acid biosynthesis glycosyltransferase [Bradyrhizobium elkanii]